MGREIMAGGVTGVEAGVVANEIVNESGNI